jgi:hypothetical protein
MKATFDDMYELTAALPSEKHIANLCKVVGKPNQCPTSQHAAKTRFTKAPQ